MLADNTDAYNEITMVDSSWIDFHFLNICQRKICVQVRPPDVNEMKSKQFKLGALNGMVIFANNTMEAQLPTATGVGLDIFIDNNHIADTMAPGNRSYVDSTKMIPISSGTSTRWV